MFSFKSIAVLFTVLTLMAITAIAQTQNQVSQPDAIELLKKVRETSQNLKTVHFEGQTVMEMKGDGFYMRLDMPFVMASGKAGQKRVLVKEPFSPTKTIISDGQTEWVYLSSEKQFTKKPFDKASLAEAGASILEQFKGDVMYAGMISEDIEAGNKSAKFLREEVIEVGSQKVNCYVIEVTIAANEKELKDAVQSQTDKPKVDPEMEKNLFAPMTFWVDKERMIVVRHSFDGGGMLAAFFRAFAENAKFNMTTTLSVAKINEALPDSLFAFAPPADAKEVEKFDSKLAGLLDDDEPERESLIGTDAVSFSLADLNGKRFSMDKLRGKVVVIDFWASWCGPCRETMPHVEKLHKEFKDKGLVVLGINDEEAADARKFVQKHRYTFPTLIDAESSVSEQYGIQAIPQTFVIDRDGKIVAQFFGTGKEEELRQTVQDLLAAKAESNSRPAKKQIARR